MEGTDFKLSITFRGALYECYLSATEKVEDWHIIAIVADKFSVSGVAITDIRYEAKPCGCHDWEKLDHDVWYAQQSVSIGFEV